MRFALTMIATLFSLNAFAGTTKVKCQMDYSGTVLLFDFAFNGPKAVKVKLTTTGEDGTQKMDLPAALESSTPDFRTYQVGFFMGSLSFAFPTSTFQPTAGEDTFKVDVKANVEGDVSTFSVACTK